MAESTLSTQAAGNAKWGTAGADRLAPPCVGHRTPLRYAHWPTKETNQQHETGSAEPNLKQATGSLLLWHGGNLLRVH